MENNSYRSCRVRKYEKSSVPRLRWTPELHDHFVQSVQKLGGKYKATPKRILQMMAVRGLKISHIKSHLQMYRSTKELKVNKIYQENKSDAITLLPIRQVSEGLREPASTNTKLSQRTRRRRRRRRRIQEDGESLFCHKYLQGKKGCTSSSNAIAETNNNDGEISKPNIDQFTEANAIKFWGLALDTNQTVPQSINLDLTMSSQYFVH